MVGLIETVVAGLAAGDQAGIAQHVQVLRDGGERGVEVSGDLAGGELLIPNQAQDGAAAGTGDGVEGGLHY